MSALGHDALDEIQEARGRYINGCLYAGAVLGFPALASSVLRAFQTGWHSTTYLHIGLYVLVLVMATSSRRISVKRRAVVTLALLFAFALGSLSRWGLPGSGLVGLVAFCVLASIFLGTRAGIYATILSLAVLAILGTAVNVGIVSYDFDIHWYSTTLGAWFYKVPSMGLMVGLMIVAIAGVHSHLVQVVQALSVRTVEQAETNEQLATEVAERERTEKELRESEARNRAIVNAIPDFVLRMRRDGTTLDVKAPLHDVWPARVECMIGRKVQEMDLPAEFVSRVLEATENALDTGQVEAHEYQMEVRGVRRELEVRIAPCGTDEILAIVRDMTERKEAEEERKRLESQIQHAQKLESLGVLTGGIAHDFNNLLTSVLGHADLALMKLSSESPALKYVQQIQTATVRAAELTNQMLAYSGKGKFVVQELDLNRLIREMTHLLEVSISKSVILKYNLHPDLPSINADATQVRQVIMNLITNASESIGNSSGVVTLDTGIVAADRDYFVGAYLDENLPDGSYVFVEVTDTGTGMDEGVRHRIFDPFFTTKFTGRGLGLAAVLGIVRGHRGAIKIYSEPGKGTSFKVLFPASGPFAANVESERVALSNWRGSGTVLVADDEESVRTVAKQMLEQFGFDVILTKDGRDAVDVFRRRSTEIVTVLLDMTMPDVDGHAAFAEIRRIVPDARVILMSGYNEHDATTRFAGKGLAGFIQKPFRLDALIDKVREVLER